MWSRTGEGVGPGTTEVSDQRSAVLGTTKILQDPETPGPPVKESSLEEEMYDAKTATMLLN